MAKISNKDRYTKHDPVNPKAYFVLTDPVTGKTHHLEIQDINGEIVITDAFVNKIVSGKATWLQGWQYVTTQIICIFNGTTFNVDSTVQTLNPSHDTLNRYDIITVKLSADGTGVSVNVIQGQDAVHPVVPTPDIADTEMVLTTIRINAGSDQPSGVSKVKIYDELAGEPTEYTVIENSGGSGITLENPEHPNTLAKSIKVNYALLNSTDIITMSSSVSEQTSDISSLDFYVYIGTDISALIATPEPKIEIKLFNGATQVGSAVWVKNGVYGLNTQLTSAQQPISIPFDDFGAGFANTADYQINKITIGFIESIGTEIFLDTFDFVKGVGNPIYSNTLLGLDDVLDSTYLGKEGFSLVVANNQRGAELKRTALLTDLYQGSKVIVGDYSRTPNTDRTYDAWASIYMINNNLYADEGDYISAQLTLNAPPVTVGEERIDVIAVRVDTTASFPPTKEIVVIEGTAGVSPVEKPSIDLLTEAELSFVILRNGEATPVEIIDDIVYDENVEWTNILASTDVNLDYAIVPYSGSKCVYFPKNSASQKAEIAWQKVSLIDYSEDSKVSFGVFFQEALKNNVAVEVFLKNGANTMGAIVLDKKSLQKYGYNPNTKTGWSVVNIPIIDFTPISRNWLQHDIIDIKISNTSFGKLDLVFLQYGTVLPPSNTCCEMTMLADCGALIRLDNQKGTLSNMAGANTTTAYTITGTKAGSWHKLLINTTSEPTVTGATKIFGSDWVTGTDMYLVVTNNGNKAEYWFEQIGISV